MKRGTYVRQPKMPMPGEDAADQALVARPAARWHEAAEDRERKSLNGACSEPLDESKDDELPESGREPAEHRAGDETGDRPTVAASMYAVKTHEEPERAPRSAVIRGSAVATIDWSRALRVSVIITPAITAYSRPRGRRKPGDVSASHEDTPEIA
jgi:hypothetical protein